MFSIQLGILRPSFLIISNPSIKLTASHISKGPISQPKPAFMASSNKNISSDISGILQAE